MSTLTSLRYVFAVAFCIITTITIGCSAIPYQLVDAEALQTNKSKPFKLGVVKAAGNPLRKWYTYDHWGPFYVEYKKNALDNIPIAEICSQLSSQYSIAIDANVDKTLRVSTGEVQEQQWDEKELITITRKVAYAYYGDPVSTIGDTDIVNVTYSLDPDAIFKNSYDIEVISSGQRLIMLHGIVESIASDSVLHSYVDNAKHIIDALKRDLPKKYKFEEGDRSGRTGDAFKNDLNPL